MSTSGLSLTFQEQVLAELRAINSRLDEAQDAELRAINNRLETQQQRLDRLAQDGRELNLHLETYQKASDKLITLVSAIITGAFAVVILTPLGRVLADFSAKALGLG